MTLRVQVFGVRLRLQNEMLGKEDNISCQQGEIRDRRGKETISRKSFRNSHKFSEHPLDSGCDVCPFFQLERMMSLLAHSIPFLVRKLLLGQIISQSKS